MESNGNNSLVAIGFGTQILLTGFRLPPDRTGLIFPTAEKREQQRLPLRAFKKIGRVGTLPALVNSSNPANIQLALHGSTPPQLGAGGGGSGDEVPALSGSAMSSGSRATAAGMGSAFQRWNHRRGSHLGWDSARPQSAARQQQQMLEKIYTKGELKEYQQLFKMFDTDGSGAIGSEEVGIGI